VVAVDAGGLASLVASGDAGLLVAPRPMRWPHVA